MDIRNIRELKNTAARRLDQAAESKKIILIYSAISILSALLVTVITYCLDLQVDRFGGLSHMGTRSMLSSISAVLPMVLNMALMCLELGFMAAMLRIGRGLYTSPQTLRAGMPRFWAMIRTNLLILSFCFVVGMAAFYLAMMVFVMTPFSDAAMEILLPIVNSADPAMLVLEESVELRLMDALTPLLVIFGILFLALALPITYRYRMANYVLMHDPRAGAFAALRRSRDMMRGNCLALVKIDLSLWWYYGLSMLSMLVCYGELLLAAFGVTLPMSPSVSFFLFYGLSLAIVFVTNIFFRGRVGVTYAMVFDAIRPKEENSGGVVLGNIFQM